MLNSALCISFTRSLCLQANWNFPVKVCKYKLSKTYFWLRSVYQKHIWYLCNMHKLNDIISLFMDLMPLAGQKDYPVVTCLGFLCSLFLLMVTPALCHGLFSIKKCLQIFQLHYQGFLKGVLVIWFGSLEIGKIINGSLESEKIRSLQVHTRYLTFSLKKPWHDKKTKYLSWIIIKIYSLVC